MTTQSLRGMANHGPMHWRGDRTGGNDAPSAQPDGGAFDEVAAFKQVQPGLHGSARARRAAHARGDAAVHRLHAADHVPAEPGPQPGQLAHARAAGGRDFYFGTTVAPSRGRARRATGSIPTPIPARASFKGFFGTDGRASFDAGASVPQDPAPAQHVPEGRHVRRGLSTSSDPRRFLPGRSGPRLRLRT